MNALLRKLDIDLPIIQAPMAGVSTPAMAGAVSNAGGLGSIGVGSVNTDGARRMILEVRARTDRSFSVKVFCHVPAVPDRDREAEWLARLAPEFSRYGASAPATLTAIRASSRTTGCSRCSSRSVRRL